MGFAVRYQLGRVRGVGRRLNPPLQGVGVSLSASLGVKPAEAFGSKGTDISAGNGGKLRPDLEIPRSDVSTTYERGDALQSSAVE
jgi:hypothetical protein